MNIKIDYFQALELCKTGKPDFIDWYQWHCFKVDLAGTVGRRLRLEALRAEQAEGRTTTRPASETQFRPSVLAA